ncbi:hypothetical protein CGC56_01300 [Capnocytophaga canimorsus]|uniref:Uncharacterized protein n=1 Tax=Capnocytophaga canimorsus TaxID=28188 RepID=A0A250G0R3_9FLAO|nr:hypothetical protein [Capnocytophaga canimorsus]ATA90924.1 hypothetical protein CGC56_01300 [Capnocytophaga canimorsus]
MKKFYTDNFIYFVALLIYFLIVFLICYFRFKDKYNAEFFKKVYYKVLNDFIWDFKNKFEEAAPKIYKNGKRVAYIKGKRGY